MTGDGGFHVHLSGDPSTFQPEATYTLRSKHNLKKWQKSLLQKGSTWCHYLFKYLLPSMEIIFVPVCLVTWLTRCQTVSQDSSLLQKTQTVASKLFLQAAHFCSSKSFRLNRDSGSSGAFQLLGDVHTRCFKIFAHNVLSKTFAHKVFSNICATIFTHIMIPIWCILCIILLSSAVEKPFLTMRNITSNRFSDHCTNTVTETSQVEKEHVQVPSSSSPSPSNIQGDFFHRNPLISVPKRKPSSSQSLLLLQLILY